MSGDGQARPGAGAAEGGFVRKVTYASCANPPRDGTVIE
jgi:hypothetical protein